MRRFTGCCIWLVSHFQRESKSLRVLDILVLDKNTARFIVKFCFIFALRIRAEMSEEFHASITFIEVT
jgi:hypothetical protein